jgi:hypothetical protein
MAEPSFAAWFATEHHPRGASAEPCFDVIGSMVYPAVGHPAGAGTEPWYQMRGDCAYPVAGHPCGPSREPALRVDADLVYPVSDDLHDSVTAPWFELRWSPE